MPEPGKFHVTTPLYHASSRPNIGHAYTALAADVLTRHLRAGGREVFFRTGADAHAAGVAGTARARGAAPGDWADGVSADFERAWKLLNIGYDSFLRTTDPEHARRVRDAFGKLLASGDIYPGACSGPYCAACGSFYDVGALRGDGLCPVHRTRMEKVSGDAYFFRLSRYARPLLRHYAANPAFLAPARRAAEMAALVKNGLEDIPVARSGVGWGIPVSSDPEHTVQAWFGALLAHITGAGWEADRPAPGFARLWPADLHLADAESFRLHATAWPAILLALGLPLPRRIYAHGGWTIEGDGMSGTGGDAISPSDIIKEYGADALRYFLFRETPFGQDGDFSAEAFRRRYNADLAGDLGGLFSRVLGLADKYPENGLPNRPEEGPARNFARLRALEPRIAADIEELNFSSALDRIWGAVGELNGCMGPEKRREKERDPAAGADLLKDMVWCLRLLAGWLYPFMPDTSARMQMIMSMGTTAAGVEPQKAAPLFPVKD